MAGLGVMVARTACHLWQKNGSTLPVFQGNVPCFPLRGQALRSGPAGEGEGMA